MNKYLEQLGELYGRKNTEDTKTRADITDKRVPPVSQSEVIPFPKLVSPAEVNAFLAPCGPLEDDLKFIHRNLPSDPKERRQAVVHYRRIWLAAMDAEPARHRKQNAGRKTANIWLRTGATP